MKTKIVVFLMFISASFLQAQNGGVKSYIKDLTPNVNSPVELTDSNNNSLSASNVYRVRLVTRGTGTRSGAEFLVWAYKLTWQTRMVSSNGTHSNHPSIIVDNNIIKVATEHTHNYPIRVFIEELSTIEDDAVPSIFGASYQWQRKVNNLFYTDGHVGIGTDDPKAKLHIEDNQDSKMILKSKSSSSNVGILLQGKRASSTANSSHYIGTDGESHYNLKINADENIKLQTNGTDKVVILSNGDVGIGTPNPKGFKLGVDGRIAATEVKIAKYENWSDFVFEEEYQLPTLKEVENHISKKGHLKDIPSAKEVKENGFFLGEMDAKLLQKIEELTLYTINQEKQLQSQNNKIKQLEKENTQLKSLLERVAKLEKQINK
ncbi:hypothetical protein [Tenacibaculum sp. 190524A02b]|uniref:hypothetical protein n=1 Tax=Tenacibaculum vairaonense TaxID=3137860 RepID=UPI0032B2F8B0